PSGKPDLSLLVCDPPAPTAGGKNIHAIEPRHASAAVFTQNVVVGAPVEIGRKWRESQGRGGKGLRAVLINAGCSNAATGKPGVEDALATMRCVAEQLRCAPDEVLPSSTGIIGHRLPVQKINSAIPALVGALARGEKADQAAADAIMTTDLVSKQAHREFELDRHQVHIGAIGKGSG